ncbi:hemerythrin domain-containing protein [Cryptosporangium aurantiacum]|uniref:Hemerythrin HHE cation binding domain-containing protein n=1 Tax=Cryptosporangium aurantiacum TaxID=134849 RepID=A0A1M7RCK8_9ACTN|nr:hemerythrin domain-containing protein [Cryptosporangium aurantiacum]SHN44027.1 Hemerythrin HHE cation binding domain-containing protein [Cryptosporangium aurantiacum]
MRPIDVRPRNPGDPVPDTLGLRLAHRVMLADAARLAALVEDIAAGQTRCDRPRARAIAAYLVSFCDSVHHHHTVEDAVLRPVVEASAGSRIDFTGLTDDHAELDPRLDQLRVAAAAFAAEPDEDTATTLAVGLAELRDLLSEHIADEEAALLPIIEAYVSVANWDGVERQIRERADLAFEVPRIVAVTTPEELAALKADGGLVIRLLLAVLGPRFRKRERAVFGP